jgi:hypothetical protein
MMRAMMEVRSVEKNSETQQTVTMAAVSSKPYGKDGESEENTFARYTPMANLTMSITNPAFMGKLQQGQKLFVDFSLVE